MNTAFVLASPSFFPRNNSLPTCRRRLPAKRATFRPRSAKGPTMMAKFQKQEATSESPEGDSLLEEIIPPPALPSLTTLSGKIPDIQPKAPDDEVDLSKISTSGPALSTEDEDSIKSFLAGVAEEVKIVEWPSFSRVLRLTFIILVTLVSAVVALYFVDGFFYRISHVLFDV